MSINIDHLIMNADYSVFLIVYPITKNERGRKLLSLKGISNKYHFEAAVDTGGEGQWGVQRKGAATHCWVADHLILPSNAVFLSPGDNQSTSKTCCMLQSAVRNYCVLGLDY